MGLQTFPKKQPVEWRSAAECSTVGQQRLEKLDSRWLKDGCVEQQAMMSMQSGDADGPRQQTTGGIRQRGTAEPSGINICTPRRLAWTRSQRRHRPREFSAVDWKLIFSRLSFQTFCACEVTAVIIGHFNLFNLSFTYLLTLYFRQFEKSHTPLLSPPLLPCPFSDFSFLHILLPLFIPMHL